MVLMSRLLLVPAECCLALRTANGIPLFVKKLVEAKANRTVNGAYGVVVKIWGGFGRFGGVEQIGVGEIWRSGNGKYDRLQPSRSQREPPSFLPHFPSPLKLPFWTNKSETCLVDDLFERASIHRQLIARSITTMLPFLRRLPLPLAAISFVCILLSKTSPAPDSRYLTRIPKFQEPLRVPIAHPFPNGSKHDNPAPGLSLDVKVDKVLPDYSIPVVPSTTRTTIPQALLDLTTCSRSPNRFTGHIRLPNLLYNISMKAPTSEEQRAFWNPTIVALPYWSNNQYIVVSMVAPHGEAYRRNVLCEANICHPKTKRSNTSREKHCTEEDLGHLGPNGGLRCVTAPIEVDVPPTPAERCSGMEQQLADIPGFHDPRLFYSGRGEPILMVVSQ